MPRTQEFALLAYSFVQSQLVKDGEDFLLKKGTPKDSQGFGPYQNKPFCGPHHKKRAVTNRFPQVGGNIDFRGHFRPHSRGRGHGPPPPPQ